MPENSVLQVRDSSEYGAHFSHKQLWKTAEREPAVMEPTKYVARALKPLLYAASKSVHSLSDCDPVNNSFHASGKPRSAGEPITINCDGFGRSPFVRRLGGQEGF